MAPKFEEQSTPLPPSEEAMYFAEQKARSLVDLCPDSLLLGSDTLVACDGEKLGKPKDIEDAIRILRKLSGKTHWVHTALVLLDTATGSLKSHVESVAVTFYPISEEDNFNYVKSGEPMGKAGAYALQGKGRAFISRVDGDEEAVIGLPLTPIRKWLGL